MSNLDVLQALEALNTSCTAATPTRTPAATKSEIAYRNSTLRTLRFRVLVWGLFSSVMVGKECEDVYRLKKM